MAICLGGEGNGGTTDFTVIEPPSVLESGYGFVTITGKVRNATGKYQQYVEARCTVMQNGVQIADTLGNGSLSADAIWEYRSLGQLSPSTTSDTVQIECRYSTNPFN